MTRIYIHKDKFLGDVHEYLKQLAASGREAPGLTWVEPRPGLWSPADMGSDPAPSLVPGWPATDRPMDEARLFWPSGFLHVVARISNGEVSCRFVEIHENEPAQERALQREVFREAEAILLRTDWDRFGLSRPPIHVEKVTVVSYRDNGTLLGWRILPEGVRAAQEKENVEQ